MTELVLIRHGVTAWNKERRFQGHIDIPLDDEGHRQAARVGARFAAERRSAATAVAAVYASDLSRAWHTAQPIAAALGLAPQAEAGLRERHYGAFEGLDHEQLLEDHREAFERWRARELDFELPGGGESLRSFHGRIETTLRALAARHAGARVVAVTHGGVLDCAFRLATGLELAAPRRHELLNASLNRIGWDGQRFSLIAWADVAHLEYADDEIDTRG